MTTYGIGTLAEHLVILRIHASGTLTAHLGRREPADFRVLNVGASRGPVRLHAGSRFAARVATEHEAILEIVPPGLPAGRGSLIPLGSGRPFLDSELPPSPGADGAFSFSPQVEFVFDPPALAWRTENLSARCHLAPNGSPLRLILRLPPGNRGLFEFAEPIFPDPGGRRFGLVPND